MTGVSITDARANACERAKAFEHHELDLELYAVHNRLEADLEIVRLVFRD